MKKKTISKKKKSASKAISPIEIEETLAQTDEQTPQEITTLPAKISETLPSSTQDPLALYLREIAKVPLLNPEQERNLAILAFDEKDKSALKKLIQANLRFVVKIAFEYSRFGHKVLDLIQEGNMGLIQAVHHFNPYKDVRLTTYAVWWIRSYIRDYLLRNWSIVRIGTTAAQKKLFYNLKKEQEIWERQGIKPHVKALAYGLGVKEEEVASMQQRLSGRDSSLTPKSGPEGDESISILSTLSDDAPLASDDIQKREGSQLIKAALEEFQDELDDREKDFVARRLLSETPITLEEFGKHYNISKERSRQIEERIKKKLKEFLQKYYPDISVDT